MHNNGSFDSHASFTFIHISSFSDSLGSPAYEVHADMFSESGVEPKVSHVSQPDHFPSTQPSLGYWESVHLCICVHICSHMLLMEMVWICTTILPFSLSSLNSLKPKANLWYWSNGSFYTALCFDSATNTLAGRHILWCISGLGKIGITQTLLGQKCRLPCKYLKV